MESWIKQIREKLIGAEEEENKADFGGSRDQKIAIQKNSYFKEKKKANNWFQRQFSRNMSHDYDFIEMEHATAVAAAAFAISSHVSEITHEKNMSGFSESTLTKTRSNVFDRKSTLSQLGSASKRLSGSFKSTDEQVNKVPTTSIIREEKKPDKTITLPPAPSMKKTPTFSEYSKRTNHKKPDMQAPKKTPTFGDNYFNNTDDSKPETSHPNIPPQVDDPTVYLTALPPPPPPPLPPQPPIRQTSTSTRPSTRPGTHTTGSKADAWEREELNKIKERYERLLETIETWEKRKKMKARRKLNKHEQRDNERKKQKAWRKYEEKIKYIDGIAAGARAQSDEKRKNETIKAKEKANIIRTTGKLPGACSCF